MERSIVKEILLKQIELLEQDSIGYKENIAANAQVVLDIVEFLTCSLGL